MSEPCHPATPAEALYPPSRGDVPAQGQGQGSLSPPSHNPELNSPTLSLSPSLFHSQKHDLCLGREGLSQPPRRCQTGSDISPPLNPNAAFTAQGSCGKTVGTSSISMAGGRRRSQQWSSALLSQALPEKGPLDGTGAGDRGGPTGLWKALHPLSPQHRKDLSSAHPTPRFHTF